MRTLLCCSLALCLGAGTASAVQLYKWVDEEGNVTYSQQRPPDQPAETIEVRVTGPDDEAARSELESLTERANAAQEDREFAATAAAELRDREQRIKKNCEVARENLRVLQNAPRVQATDDSGNPYFIDDAAREQRMAQTRQQIEDFCE